MTDRKTTETENTSEYDEKRDEKCDKEYDKEYEKEWAHPSAAYRSAPFWSWNGALEKEALKAQIDVFEKMGFGGFHIHVRNGLKAEYLGDEFFSAVEFCAQEAKKRGLYCYLYDEDRWPSGYAGGKVTQSGHRAEHLLFTSQPYNGESWTVQNSGSAVGVRSERGRLTAVFDITFNGEGYLKSFQRIPPEGIAKGIKKYCYIETPRESARYNGATYADLLNPDTLKTFLQCTHEEYAKRLGGYFGNTVPTFFTDEPQFTTEKNLPSPTSLEDGFLPWTEGIDEGFEKFCGEKLTDNIPYLFFEDRAGRSEKLRYEFHRFLSERLATSYMDGYAAWCRAHSLGLIGHVMGEETLETQTRSVGSAMRMYRDMSMPGTDNLFGRVDLAVAKQAQSVGCQYGRAGTLSELYGGTGWDRSFAEYKFQGDWQAACGVTFFVPHLSMLSMAGESKRDYPASIGEQAPWWEKFSLITEHFARLSSILTGGKEKTEIAVLHPIESFWLCYGDDAHTKERRDRLENSFSDTVEFLASHTYNFQFIDESLLKTQEIFVDGGALHVGQAAYRAVIIPEVETLSSRTLEVLSSFKEGGGKVLFLGNAPKYIDGIPSAEGDIFYKTSHHVCDHGQLERELSDLRGLCLYDEKGEHIGGYAFRRLEKEEQEWLFIAPYKRSSSPCEPRKIRVNVGGRYAMSAYNTLDGSVTECKVTFHNEHTEAEFELYGTDSLLLALTKREKLELPSEMEYRTKEPNVFLLDIAKYSYGDGKGALVGEDELLKIDDKLREYNGWTPRTLCAEQPWATEKEGGVGSELTLTFEFESEIECKDCLLAVERSEGDEILFNGQSLGEKVGYYVDRSIQTFALPRVRRGANCLQIRRKYDKISSLEWCYLLGEFGVRVNGRKKVLIERPKRVRLGDITEQGFPFYGGEFTYLIPLSGQTGARKLFVRLGMACALAELACGGEKKLIAFPPYEGEIERESGVLEVTAFLSRQNAFGQLHNAEVGIDSGPKKYRTYGNAWTYEYRLIKQGIEYIYID